MEAGTRVLSFHLPSSFPGKEAWELGEEGGEKLTAEAASLPRASRVDCPIGFSAFFPSGISFSLSQVNAHGLGGSQKSRLEKHGQFCTNSNWLSHTTPETGP